MIRWATLMIRPCNKICNFEHIAKGGAPEVLAGVVGGVNSTQHQLSSRAGGVVAVEPEREDWLRDQPLVHHVLEGRRHAPYADLWEGQPL